LQESLGENSSGALQMVSAIVALAARPTFPLLPSQRAKFVRYMVQFDSNRFEDAHNRVEGKKIKILLNFIFLLK